MEKKMMSLESSYWQVPVQITPIKDKFTDYDVELFVESLDPFLESDNGYKVLLDKDHLTKKMQAPTNMEDGLNSI